MATDGFLASRQGSIAPSQCCPGYILYLKKHSILQSDLTESKLDEDALGHPVLIIQEESSKPSHVKICGVRSSCRDIYRESILKRLNIRCLHLEATQFRRNFHTIL